MEFNFEPLVKMDTLPNYLAVARYQNRGGLDDLEYVGEKGPARAGSVDDATKKSYQVYRWEKQFDFSHEALVNDDLGYFNDVAVKMGEAARRTSQDEQTDFRSGRLHDARGCWPRWARFSAGDPRGCGRSRGRSARRVLRQ